MKTIIKHLKEVRKTGRKKKELPENAVIQKSKQLFDLWKYGFKLFDFKVFDLYLSAINSRNINTKIVTFTKADFSKILDIKQKMSVDDLDKRLAYLRQKEVCIDNGGKYPIHTSLFAACCVDTSTEPYNVKLEVSEMLLSLVFDIDRQNGHGYFSYKLRNILQIESLYSYLLFNYLESKAYRRNGNIIKTTWEVDLQELKEILNCTDVELYSEFKRFNNFVLQRCHKELTSKTEMQFDYQTVKQGRYVKAIRFTVHPHKIKLTAEPAPNVIQQPLQAQEQPQRIEKQPIPTATTAATGEPQNTLREPPKVQEPTAPSPAHAASDEKIDFFSECFDNTFTELQVKLILSAVNPDAVTDSEYGKDIALYQYLDYMYKRLLAEEEYRSIGNRCKYLVAMLKNDKGGAV